VLFGYSFFANDRLFFSHVYFILRKHQNLHL